MASEGKPFHFIEEKRKRHAHLSGLIPPYANSDDSTCVALHGDFRDLFDTLPVRIPTLWAANTKRFFFLDPFGVKGIRFDQVKKIMECPGSEIFLLLDGDGIDRVAKANNHACAAILDELFGADGWQSQVRLGSDMSGMDDRCQRVCAHYKSLLKSIDGVKYTFQFEMRSATNRHTYFLLFASRHKTGLLKMKEAMKRRDNTGEYQYCSGREGQVNLQLFNRVADDADSMHGYFGGDPDRFWTIDTIEEYALCETGFLNPKSMLAHLEKGGRIEVSPDSGRRNFTFADGAVTGVRFLKTPRVRHNIQPDMLNG